MNVAILSSFSTFGVFHDKTSRLLAELDRTYGSLLAPGHDAAAPSSCPQLPVEVYVAMEPDLRVVDEVLGIPATEPVRRPASVLKSLGTSLPDSALGRLAERIHQAVGGPEGRQIIALASFLPELSSTDSSGPATSEPACQALSNIIRLGGHLRRQFNHPVAVVEAVCGSLVHSLNPPATDGPNNESPTWNVTLDGAEKVFERLLANLQAIWNRLRTSHSSELKTFPPVALELEPGLCFALRGPSSLRNLAAQLDQATYRSLRSHVGFNLDLAHFAIAGIPLADLRENPSIRDRILHVHASGFHSKAHFGDCVPSDDNLNQLRDWFDFLKELNSPEGRTRRPHDLPPFSGCVSLEYEAAGALLDVQTALQKFGFQIIPL